MRGGGGGGGGGGGEKQGTRVCSPLSPSTPSVSFHSPADALELAGRQLDGGRVLGVRDAQLLGVDVHQLQFEVGDALLGRGGEGSEKGGGGGGGRFEEGRSKGRRRPEGGGRARSGCSLSLSVAPPLARPALDPALDPAIRAGTTRVPPIGRRGARGRAGRRDVERAQRSGRSRTARPHPIRNALSRLFPSPISPSCPSLSYLLGRLEHEGHRVAIVLGLCGGGGGGGEKGHQGTRAREESASERWFSGIGHAAPLCSRRARAAPSRRLPCPSGSAIRPMAGPGA